MFGFHPLDFTVIILYFGVMIYIGIIVSRRIKNEEDFFMGSRGLGRLLQTFMNFGMATSAETSVGAARETYRQGMAGIWMHMFVLFMTPFYWFTAVWTRRLRASSMGDIFMMRYANRPMEKFYAVFGLLNFMGGIALSFMALQKTVEVVTPIPAAQMNVEQKAAIRNFEETILLQKKMETEPLTEQEMDRFRTLNALKTEGKVRSSFSFINPKFFVPFIALIVLIYTIAGGLIAAAMTDFIQGVLLIVLSFLLLPFSLIKIGGFSGLHASVPESFFNLFGSAALSEYPWYYVVALSLMGLVMVEASPHNCQVMGSAKDEEAARVGRMYGNFMKRFSIVFWGFTGVVGYGLYRHALADPDMVWGHMTRELLAPGLVGLIVVCLVAALMSTADAYIVATGALFTRNLYEPIFPGRSQREYLLVSRLAGGIVLIGAILITLYFRDILSLLRFIWSIGLIFGPVYWMGIVWRKSNVKGAWAAILYTSVFTVLLGYFLANIKPAARMPFFTQTTETRVVVRKTGAVQEDVDNGRARFVGQTIQKEIQIPSSGVFFEDVVRENPDDPDSPLIGKNRFRTSLLIPALLGINLTHLTKGDLISLGYFLDVLIPFLLIIVLSRFGRLVPEGALNRFYARLHTPVNPDPEKDKQEVQLTEQNPDRFKHRNLFKDTYIQLQKPTRRDILGFVASWAAVAGVILTVIILASIGA